MTAQAPPVETRRRLPSPRANLGTRLALTLVPLAVVPLLALGLAAYLRARVLIRDQVVTQLERAVSAQSQRLQDWRSTHELPLWTETQRSTFTGWVDGLMANLDRPRQAQTLRDQIVARLESINQTNPENPYAGAETLFSGLMVVRASDGLILAASPTFWEGDTVTGLAQMPQTATHITREMSFSRATPISLMTLMPVGRGAGEPSATLVGVANETRLIEVIQEALIAAVPTSDVYILIPPDTVIRYDPLTIQLQAIRVAEHPVFTRMATQSSGDLEFTNLDGTPVLAYYNWLPDLQAGLVVEMPQGEAYAGLNSLFLFSLILLIATVIGAGFIVTYATGRALRPLGALTTLAERIAQGDLNQRVPVAQEDEIGRMAAAFNAMAQELQGLYQGLERRVDERTRQIRTAAEVARDAAAVRNIDQLLNEAVHLISERFGFYHAGVFLMDERGENAILRAASSEGGRRMLQRGHSLSVGKTGIVGYVTGTGSPRIALDVGTDAVHFANPDLPDTRSEMALPLRVGERVIGALDVQSAEANAFDGDDLLVLQTMADQVAIAIENATLLGMETERAAQRRRIVDVSRQITEQIGFREMATRSVDLVRRTFDYQRVTLGLVEGTEVIVRASSATAPTRPMGPGIRVALGQGILGQAVTLKAPILVSDLAADERMPLIGGSQTDPRALLAVPLMSRGQAIGAIAVERLNPGSLGEPDAEILETLAGILAVAIENARLFEDMEQSLQQVDALYRRQTRDAWDDVLRGTQADPSRQVYEFALRGGTSPSDQPPLEAAIALRGESIGVLRAEAPQTPTGWDEVDKDVLESVAEEVATALEQIRLVDETQRRATQLQAAAEIARDATGLLDLPTLLGRASELIASRFGFYHVGVFLLDPQGKSAILRGAAGEAFKELLARGHTIPVGSPTSVGRVASSGQHALALDVAHDPTYVPHPLLPQTRSELTLPLKIGPRVIGAIDIHHVQPLSFSEDDVNVLQILADQLSVAVENARLFDETFHRARREQAILDITNKVRSSTDVDGMIRTAVQELRKVLGARQARVRLVPEAMATAPAQAEPDDHDRGTPLARDQAEPPSSGSTREAAE